MSFNYTSMADFNQNAQQQYKNTLDAFSQQLSAVQENQKNVSQEYAGMQQGIQNWGQAQQYGASQVYGQNLANIQQGDVSRGLGNTTVQNSQQYQAAGGYQQALLGINQSTMQQKLGVQGQLAQFGAQSGQQLAGVYGNVANYLGGVGQVSQQFAGQSALAQQQFGYQSALANQQASAARAAQGGATTTNAPPVTATAPYGFQQGAVPTAGGYGMPGSVSYGSPGDNMQQSAMSGNTGNDYGYGNSYGGGGGGGYA